MTLPFQPDTFTSKHPHVASSIFSRMSQLAQENQAINLSQGFPDFEVDARLIDLVDKNMKSGNNQYAPMTGVSALRQVIANKIRTFNQIDLDPDAEITITAGGTQGIFTIIATLVNPGDEVIIFEPAYDSYAPSVRSFGGKVVPVALIAPDFTIDWTMVNELVSSKTKLIIINNPNNPTGRRFSGDDIKSLEELAVKHSFFVLSDDVYEHILFDGQKHQSILSSSILKDRSFVVASFGKLLHTTGWKIGYVIASAFLTNEFRKIHQFNVFSVNTPIQFAIAEYLHDMNYYSDLSTMFEQKRDFLKESLAGLNVDVLPCEGTYFLLVDYSKTATLPEMEYATYLTKFAKVATVPVSAFYSNGVEQRLLRLCFAKKDETLTAAITNLSSVWG